jgi:hypothetical protein
VSRPFALLAAVGAALVLGASSATAAPVNDAFSAAKALSSAGTQSFSATTFGASTEAGEPDVYVIQRTVWFTWKAPATGGVYLQGCASDADLDVYTGTSLATLDRVSGGGGKCGGDARFKATAGVTYRLRVNARTIAAGTTSTVTLKQVTATPNAAMVAPPAVTSRVGKLSFKETTGAESPLIEDCKVDAIKLVSCVTDGEGTWYAALSSVPGLGSGTHTLSVTLRDFYWNVDPTPLVYTFSVDATPPETTFVGTPDPYSGTVQLQFGADEPGSTFECRLDAPTWVPCSSPWTVSVALGFHTALVRAVDPVGNVDATDASLEWQRKEPAAAPKPAPTTFTAPVAAAAPTAGGATQAAAAGGSVPAAGASGCRVVVTRPSALSRRMLRRGVKLKVAAQGGCRWSVALRRAGGRKALVARTGAGGGTAAVTLKLSRRAAARIPARSRMELVIEATGAPGRSRSVQTLNVLR